MGSLEKYPTSCSEITGCCWDICTKADLQTTDVKGYALVSKDEYKVPKTTPETYDCAAESLCKFTTSTAAIPTPESWLTTYGISKDSGGSAPPPPDNSKQPGN